MTRVLGRAAVIFTGLSLAWEIAQLPLYTIWWIDPPGWIAFAVVHCTGGDLLIGAMALAFALLIAGRGWPERPTASIRVALLTTAFGTIYTIYSEWVNLARGAWTYSEWMPVLPPFGTGASPALQWIILPGFTLYLAQRTFASRAATRVASAASAPQQIQ